MNYQSKHQERDTKLPTYRQIIGEAIEQDLMDDEYVIAIFYGGSVGNRDTDNYSDIDLRIVVQDDRFEQYRQQKKQRASKWGNVLFYEDFPYTNYSTAHYDHFIKVDSFYYRLTDIMPSVWLQNIEIVFDESELLEDILAKSMTLTYELQAEVVEMWRTKFFSYLHEAYRRVMRNELYYALQCLDNLRFSIVKAWDMEAGRQPNTFGDWAKVEGDRSPLQAHQLALLASWNATRDPHEIMQVIERIVPEFKRLHRVLCERVRMEEDEAWLEEVLHKVL